MLDDMRESNKNELRSARNSSRYRSNNVELVSTRPGRQNSRREYHRQDQVAGRRRRAPLGSMQSPGFSPVLRGRRRSISGVRGRRNSPFVSFVALAVGVCVFLGGYLLFNKLFHQDVPPSASLASSDEQSKLVDETYVTDKGDIASSSFDYGRASLVTKQDKRDLLQTFQYAKAQEIPSALMENLALNPETLYFVSQYPRLKQAEPAQSVENISLVHNGIPHLLQFDTRWGAATYGDEPLALSGCGPTVVSMLVIGLTGDKSSTPYEVSRYAFAHGYYSELGSSWDLFTRGLEHYGLRGVQMKNVTQAALIKQLQAHHPIVASMRPGDFTTLGHFIILTGIDEQGNIIVNDPNSLQRTQRTWDPKVIVPQIKTAFVVSKPSKK